MSSTSDSDFPGSMQNEVEMIISDLTASEDVHLGISWETRPLQADDDYWQSPGGLTDGAPRYIVVKLTIAGGTNAQVADRLSPPGVRDLYIAEWAQDAISEET